MMYTLDQFAEDIRTPLQRWSDSKDAVLSMGASMQRLAREGGDLWRLGEPATISSGLPGRRLVKDPNGLFTLLLAQYAPDTPTTVHSHEGWVVICLLEGGERYTSWRRVGDSANLERMQLEVAQDHHLAPGDLAYLFNEPFNIHRQWPQGAGAVEIVLMAGRGRRLFNVDEATGACEAALDLGR
jgi:hypothetical protein